MVCLDPLRPDPIDETIAPSMISLMRKFLYRRYKKYLRYPFAVITQRKTIPPQQCIICHGTSLKKWIVHMEWGQRMWRCTQCNHGAFYGEAPIIHNTFKTNIPRAEEHLKMIQKTQFISFLEVGTPDDFYFLKQLKKRRNNIHVYGYDIFYKSPPEGITMVKKFISVEYVYASHVIEHMKNPHEFIRYLKNIPQFFLEVPSTPSWYEFAVRKGKHTSQHYHFFSEKSWSILLEGLSCEVKLNTKIIKGRKYTMLQAIKHAG